jgi:putative transposase
LTAQVVTSAETLGGIRQACDALGLSRATYYRRLQPRPVRKRQQPARALNEQERTQVLDTLNSERFVDQSPAQVSATLIEEGKYLCSLRTMYRVLAAHHQTRERRNLLRHPRYTKPELLATGPNELWSWDITKLKGPAKWNYFYLYVILDVFSRYVVGWMLADRESARLAKRLIAETCARQRISEGQLTLHADRGSSMKSKLVAQLLADLSVTKTHSRPHVSNDNPYSESHFKTMKYRPDFPSRFGSREDAMSFCRGFFDWYNNSHHHSGLHFLTPAQVHNGQADVILARRQATLDRAFAEHPERFPNGAPRVPSLPKAVWINPPKQPENSPSANTSPHTETLIYTSSN